MDRKAFQVVSEYFDNVDRITQFVYWSGVTTTNGACFRPTPIMQLGICLEELLARKVIYPSQISHDAGYGDSRVVNALIAHGLTGTGSELDPLWAARGKFHSEMLFGTGAVGAIQLAHGDFNDDRTYEEGLGIRFEDIAIFYNYHNNPERLAAKKSKLSPNGTVYLLACHSEREPDYDGLKHAETLPLDPKSRWARFLHAYRKSATIIPVSGLNV